MGRVETWTWSVRRGSQQFISLEIVKSDPISCFLQVDPILHVLHLLTRKIERFYESKLVFNNLAADSKSLS
jgi:hypothetical protein